MTTHLECPWLHAKHLRRGWEECREQMLEEIDRRMAIRRALDGSSARQRYCELQSLRNFVLPDGRRAPEREQRVPYGVPLCPKCELAEREAPPNHGEHRPEKAEKGD